jgi:hypothetical protein
LPEFQIVLSPCVTTNGAVSWFTETFSSDVLVAVSVNVTV